MLQNYGYEEHEKNTEKIIYQSKIETKKKKTQENLWTKNMNGCRITKMSSERVKKNQIGKIEPIVLCWSGVKKIISTSISGVTACIFWKLVYDRSNCVVCWDQRESECDGKSWCCVYVQYIIFIVNCNLIQWLWVYIQNLDDSHYIYFQTQRVHKSSRRKRRNQKTKMNLKIEIDTHRPATLL